MRFTTTQDDNQARQVDDDCLWGQELGRLEEQVVKTAEQLDLARGREQAAQTVEFAP